MNISDSKIIVSGAASGFGYYLAERLSKISKKIIAIDKNVKLSENFPDSENINSCVCDLTDHEKTSEVIRNIFLKDPDINILINNAGVIHSEPIINLFNRKDKKHSYESWSKMLDINLSSVFNCSVNTLEQMISHRTKGLIINISSISANGNMGQSVYSAAKSGVNALTKVWSKELSMFGIRVAGLAPGFFETPSTHKSLKENTIAKIKKEIPSKRFGELSELAHAVKFIIENDYFNGKILELDGGLELSL